jgi:hypothetical protein
MVMAKVRVPKKFAAILREDFLKQLATRDLYEIIRSNAIHSAYEP